GSPLDPDINIFGIFAVNDYIHPLGMFHGRGDTLEIAHRAHASVEIQDLPQRDVQRTYAPAHGSRQRPFNRNSEIAHGLDRFIGQPLLEFVVRLFTGEHFKPGDLPLPAIDAFHGGVKHALGRLPDVPPRSVALDVGDAGRVGNDEFASHKLDCLSVRRYGPAVIRWLHVYVPLWVVTAVTRMEKNNTPISQRTHRERVEAVAKESFPGHTFFMSTYDLICIGAGPTGLACAIEAKRAGMRPLVI